MQLQLCPPAMTLYFNVTDAVGSASNHGITRTERRLAAALAADERVQFVVIDRGRCWTAGTEAVLARLQPEAERRSPVVERFGEGSSSVERSPSVRRLADEVVRRVRARRSGEPQLPPSSLTRTQFDSDDALISVGLDWVHGTLGEAERLVFGHGGRFVGLCYDTIPIDHPEWVYPPDPGRFAQHLARLVRTSSRVMCISQCTQRDLLRHQPGIGPLAAPVVRLGADLTTTAGADELAWVDSTIGDQPYAIYCATIDRRKNHMLLYRAVKEMIGQGIEGRLVLVGMIGSGAGDLIDAMRHDRSLAGRIVHVSGCDDAHLAALYQRARFAVYPSLYEGWGLGVTEALAYGKACIVASGSSLEEAGLGFCTALHPLRTRDWVDLMSRYFGEPPSPPTVRLPTWADTAATVMDCALA